MFVKKFEAASLEQALALVKTEFGPNALILSTLEKKGKWFQKPQVEVTAASERKDEKASPSETVFDEGTLDDLFPHRKFDGYARPKTNPARAAAARSTQKYIEMDSLPTERRASPKPYEGGSLEQVFLHAGITAESARELTRRLKEDFPKKEMASPELVDRAKLRVLSSYLRTVTPDMIQNRTEWVAVGPPGGGKTSFLVKLALDLKKRRVPICLVSGDTRKVFGKNELAAYARLIRVKFNADAHKNNEGLSLIDTPALGPAIDTSLRVLCEGRSTFVVLDASTRLTEMLRVIERALPLNPMAIAFTRLDLVAQYGVIFDLLKSTKLPLLSASLSPSFRHDLKFFENTELANMILKQRGVNEF